MHSFRFGASQLVLLLIAATACNGNANQSTATPAAGEPFDPSAVSGTVVLGGWRAGPDETTALRVTLDAFKATYPKIAVKYEPITADYTAAMTAKFRDHKLPDLFLVESATAPDWIRQGLLYPLDDWISSRGFDTSQFYQGYLSDFRGTDNKIYGLPRQGEALGLAYNVKTLAAAGISGPPSSWTQLVADARKLSTGKVHALCLAATLDRALAFIYQDGGALLTDDKKSAAIGSAASKDALKWYLDLYKNGYAVRASDLGDDSCGASLGTGKVAMVIESGSLDSLMATYPRITYNWALLPTGKQNANLGFAVSYSIGKDSANKDAAWVLLTFLTGPQGMKIWTQGGVAIPSRKDVPVPAGKEVLVKGSEVARPWSFIPGFTSINDAFDRAMNSAIDAGSDDTAGIVSETEMAIDRALNS